MTLEDFEKELARGKEKERSREDRKSRKHRDREHKQSSSHRHRDDDEERDDRHRHKRRRHSHGEDEDDRERRKHRHKSRDEDYDRHRDKDRRDKDKHRSSHRRSRSRSREKDRHRDRSRSKDRSSRHKSPVRDGDEPQSPSSATPVSPTLQRDSWMQAPSALDVDYKHKRSGGGEVAEPVQPRSAKADFELKIHENEMNRHHLEKMREGDEDDDEDDGEEATRTVDYKFGDSGSNWRMMKLARVRKQAKEQAVSEEAIARKQYGDDLWDFDAAREEEREMDRRKEYGENYAGRVEVPSGDLHRERMKRDQGREEEEIVQKPAKDQIKQVDVQGEPMDPTSLNRLRAQMMKAKLRNAPDAKELEAKYNEASKQFENSTTTDIVLGAMENRMLTGGRGSEVKAKSGARARERGQVEENDEMTLDDMVREERRTKGQTGGEGKRYAERIAKDGKYDNDLEYLDENAAKLAKRVQKSEINLKNAAISDVQKMNRILDNCPLCFRDESGTPPVAPVVSLATRTYLTLPTEPEIGSAPGAMIVPIQHRKNLLECDDDEWEEIRNFQKSLTRMYTARKLSVLFYENAAHPQKHAHAALAAVALPHGLAAQAPAFFREAILAAAPEWAQHRKLIDTLAAARERGMGRAAFRRSLAKEAPYFHVWFGLDGGVGHVVEDGARWPRGDLFAREVLGGMLNVDTEVVRKRGRWGGEGKRVKEFREGWAEWDWTKVLVEG